MQYVINISSDFRVLSAYVKLPNVDYGDKPIADKIPTENITDYLYVDNEYVYSPKPKANEQLEAIPEKSTEELLLETVIDHEYRICLIELGVSENDL